MTSPTISYLRGQGEGAFGDGTFAAPVAMALETGPSAIEKGDFNIDGIVDLVVAGGGQAELLYGGGFAGVGDGTFSCQRKYATGLGATDILAGDFLEDGVVDLFVVCSTSGSLTPLLGGCEGPNSLSITVTSPNGGEVVPAGTSWAISWTKSPGVGAVDVAVSRDGGVNWETLVENTTESHFDWNVTAPTASDAWVLVSDHALPNRADVNNAPFLIATGVGVPGPGDDGDGVGAPPAASGLSDARPNPSAGDVRFALALPSAGTARLDVYDAAGRLVRRLADGAFPAGEHVVSWDGRAADGSRQPDGVYFLRGQWDRFSATRKIVRIGAAR